MPEQCKRCRKHRTEAKLDRLLTTTAQILELSMSLVELALEDDAELEKIEAMRNQLRSRREKLAAAIAS
jgi:hypothetical protein